MYHYTMAWGAVDCGMLTDAKYTSVVSCKYRQKNAEFLLTYCIEKLFKNVTASLSTFLNYDFKASLNLDVALRCCRGTHHQLLHTGVCLSTRGEHSQHGGCCIFDRRKWRMSPLQFLLSTSEDSCV